eukprot:991488_1
MDRPPRYESRTAIASHYSPPDRFPSPFKADFSKSNNPISLQPIQPTVASNTPSRNSGGTAPVLPAERKKATFDVKKLINILDGGEKKTKRRKFIESPTLDMDFFDKIYLSTPEKLREHIRMFIEVHEDYWAKLRPSREDISWMSRSTMFKGSLMNHYGLFLPTLLTRGSGRQMMEFMMRALQMKIVGVYAQTELGHGSNVRGLETTAHYDARAREFVLNTPTLTSIKWWPGTLGKVATHCVVYAQLILDGKEHGIHEFIIQIRDANHRPYPGIELGDLGPKMGDDANDTGFMRLDNVRIPRDRMLSRFQHVTPEGKYVKHKNATNPLTHYMTMMLARSMMMRTAGDQLARAVTIAMRYSAVRKQGFRDTSADGSFKSAEMVILDYQIQQHRIFKQLSCAFAFMFTGNWVSELMNAEVNLDIGHESGGAINVSVLKELAATLNGLKALSTVMAHEGIEDCRKCCGGNGYLLASGVAAQSVDYAWQCTAEGDFVILILQTARYLLKKVRQIKAGEPVLSPKFAYLNALAKGSIIAEKPPEPSSSDGFRDATYLTRLYRYRALLLLRDVSDEFETMIGRGLSWNEAFNSCAVQLNEATRAHCISFMVGVFYEEVTAVKDPGCKSVLENLCVFFGLSHLLNTNCAGILSEA